MRIAPAAALPDLGLIRRPPDPVQEAIKQKKAIEGMDRDQVLLALGKPRHKERATDKEGTEIEDWIFGEPPPPLAALMCESSVIPIFT